MQLTIVETTPEGVRAGYDCPCGCHPSVTYAQYGDVAYDTCCCGNEFTLGGAGTTSLKAHGVFRRETQALAAPWGEPLEATWLIGRSTHPEEGHEHHAESQHDHGNGHGHTMRPLEMAPGGATDRAQGEMAIDPVCGMTVDPEAARASGRHSEYKGVDYFFCGRGCKLDFDEEPERYLDPSYTPSM